MTYDEEIRSVVAAHSGLDPSFLVANDKHEETTDHSKAQRTFHGHSRSGITDLTCKGCFRDRFVAAYVTAAATRLVTTGRRSARAEMTEIVKAGN